MLVASAHAAEPYLQKVHQFTSSIAFLSTPHHGSNLAKWATMLALSIGVVKQTNAEIIAVLKNDSEVLARIQHSFHALVRSRHRPGLTPINITPFYEELDVAGVGVVSDMCPAPFVFMLWVGVSLIRLSSRSSTISLRKYLATHQ